ncbi:MAG: OsmC family protein [Oligoflexia bacterium]|nr:OsmC family protein [Oligoflexia bacterium]
MQAKTVWKEKMQFEGESNGYKVRLDTQSPIGNDSGLTPKELVALGICGCTAMDVVALLKKFKQPLEAFEVRAEIEKTEKIHPIIFRSVRLIYDLKGSLDREKVLEAVKLSQTKYCGVSAMVSQAAPINYEVLINGETIGTGVAEFQLPNG